MAKTKYKFNIRDLIIGLLALAIVGTNFICYEMFQSTNLSLANGSQAWIVSESQIGKLKSCHDNNTRPCDIQVTIQH